MNASVSSALPCRQCSTPITTLHCTGSCSTRPHLLTGAQVGSPAVVVHRGIHVVVAGAAMLAVVSLLASAGHLHLQGVIHNQRQAAALHLYIKGRRAMGSCGGVFVTTGGSCLLLLWGTTRA
jgi:hypothetical protein